MSNNPNITPPLRRALHQSVAILALTTVFLSVPTPAIAASDPECPPPQTRDRKNWTHPDCGVHNMFVVGEKAMFLSHLPMFDSEHRYQIILEAKLKQSGSDVTEVYLQDRTTHAQLKMYTLKPLDFFVLSRVMSKNETAPLRTSFNAQVFRGHLERNPNQVIQGLENVEVEIQKVFYAAELSPTGVAPTELTYIIFGKDNDLYLAHLITRAPDFDQIINVTIAQRVFKPEELERGVTISVPNRINSPDRRLKANESVEAKARVAGASQLLPVRLNVGKEFYFEEGELLSSPIFSSTLLEKAAGF
jgi:hypothetical protein